ncbi:MAG: hypothetical protein M1813_006592 [Trichoglossum hirsutum]|nr:MAG: hypothetical protein M1813_006592 [Trichoglossum hirsutum]
MQAPTAANQPTKGKPILHVEVLLKDDGSSVDVTNQLVTQWLTENCSSLALGEGFTELRGVPYPSSVESINVIECTGSPLHSDNYQLCDVDLKVHTYRLEDSSLDSTYPSTLSNLRMLWTPDTLAGDEISANIRQRRTLEDSADGDELDTPKATVIRLPSKTFVGLWESLIYDSPIPTRLLRYIMSVALFTDHKVSSQVVNCSRLILLYGPPGTGKSTLCRALAQKLSIRLRKRFSHGKFIEINSHSLFSRWFGGSAKLVGKIFEEIEDLVDEDEDTFVCVLIDEIESLTSSRQSAASGSEPGDSMRATNALLTALDRLRARPNVIVLCTSNLIKAMDSAFLDRVDLKQYIPEPSAPAAYSIMRTCIVELQRCGIICQPEEAVRVQVDPSQSDTNVVSINEFLVPLYDTANMNKFDPHAVGTKLLGIADRCRGISGRKLRRLPVLAHSSYIQHERCDIHEFLSALAQTVGDEVESNMHIVNLQ